MRIILAVSFIFIASICLGQKISIEDAVLKQGSTFRPEYLSQLQWLPTLEFISYVKDNSLVIEDAKGKTKGSLSLSDINAITGSALKGMPYISWLNDNEFYYKDGLQYYTCNWMKRTGQVWISETSEMETIKLHEGSGAIAYTIGNDVYVQHAGKQHRVTELQEGIVAGQAIARSEFGITEGLFWSEDGSMLAFYQKDERKVTDYPLVDYTKTPAGPGFIKYPMAGSHGELASAGVYDLASGKLVYLQVTEGRLSDDYYITNLCFTPNGRYILAAIVNRAQNHMDFVRFDAKTGEKLGVMFSEDHPKYVEPEHTPLFLPGQSDLFLWFSERSGYDNLYLYNLKGDLLRQTTAPFAIRSFVGFSKKGKGAVVEAQGMNPTEQALYFIDLGTMSMTQISQSNGVHSGSLSGVGNLLIDRWSSLEKPAVSEVIDLKGKRVRMLLDSKNPLEGYEIGETTIFSIKATDGTDLWCRMITPPNMKKKEKHPVLVYTYNGPHVQLVSNSWLGGAPLWMHALAAEGYIVFSLDGRGSAHRGREFEQAIFRNLGTIELEDQEDGVNYLRQQSFVDADRMAIHGWSYGGFMTTSLMLKKPDLFKVGVAGGPVIDWNYYEIMYTERYMDTPEENPEGYSNADLTKYVGNLNGHLLMIHGTSDDVVVMQHNMAFLKACIDKGKQVDFFAYPGHAHNVRGKDRAHLMVKVLNYIKEHL
ncbi:MAG: hypothetical protein RL226_58 [Bacteroidota bacterium]